MKEDEPNKRRKVTRACDHCKQRKRRCTGDNPCTSCLSHGLKCTYLASYTRGRIIEPQPNQSAHHNAPFIAQYQGPTSAHAFLRRAWDRFGIPETEITAEDQGTIFEFGDRPSPKVQPSITHFPENAAHLVRHYFEVASPTYRFLHEPTIKEWLREFENARQSMPVSRQAIVIMVVAVGALYDMDELTDDYPRWLELEMMYRAAQQRLDTDHGRASLESVQARLTIMQYMLSTSRPNQAWYILGSTTQLMFALGMHRIGTCPQNNMIRYECRKRAFWIAYIADTYLSSMLGRPTLIKIEDVDQDLPMLVDDEDLTESVATPTSFRDCTMVAVVKHIQLIQIVKMVLRSQSLALGHESEAVASNAAIREWQESLPAYLSGAVRSSSLKPVFSRQFATVKRAHAHAVMVVNRPYILSDSIDARAAPMIDLCISAAKGCIDLILEIASEGNMFSAFWNTHYVTFNALAVLYVWIIQRQIGRVPVSQEVPNGTQELFEQAEAVRQHLSDGSKSCAPTLRYAVILEELSQEARRSLQSAPLSIPTGADEISLEDLDWQSISAFPSGLWSQLDNFPFNEHFNEQFGQLE